MRVLYNEPDPFAAEWLDNLAGDGLVPWGRVDKRPIQEITAADPAGVTQFHTFAGIGGWPLALRRTEGR